jgi:hypothetical protein
MLSKPVKTAVNRFAHAQGAKHAEITRSRVLAALEALQGTGATHAELLAYIAAWAPGPKEGQGP